MSSGCGDVLSLADLQTAKKHQIFEAEVITGKSGGVAGGADIDYATNQVTGQTQKTLPAVLRDAGFSPVSWDFSTGGTLTVNDRDKVVYDPVSKTWYSYAGTLPITVPASFNPAGNADWKPQTDPDLRENLADSSDILMGDALVAVKLDLPDSSPRSQHEKNADVISVLDFGVVDDGATDNSAAFQACFDAVSAAFPYGAEVYIPASKYAVGYYVGSTVTVPSGVNIRGDGRGSQIRAKSTLTGAVLRLAYDSNTIGRYLKDISITGNNSCNGIDTNLSSTDSVIRQVYGWKFDHVSVNEVDTAYLMQGLWHSQFIACQSGTCRIGLHLLGQCVSILVSGCHFSRDGGPVSNSSGILIEPTTYVWNGSSPVRSEAIIVNGETMCIGFQNGVYIYDGLDIHLSNLDLDYCQNTGVVVQNVNGGFSLVNSWIAAYGAGTNQFFGVTFPNMSSPQQHKLLQGLHITALNSNPTDNNIGINIGPGVGKIAIKDCTIGTGGGANTFAIAFFSNTEGSVVSGCVLGNAQLYLQSSGNLTIHNNYLTSITDTFKSAVNSYAGNTGVNTDGIIEVAIPGAGNSGTAVLSSTHPGGTYIVTSYAVDSAASADRASISGSTITVTRPTPVGTAVSSWVKYQLV